MADRSMSLDVLVRLRDQLSGPLRALKNNLASIASFGRRIGILGAAIGAISFMGPLREAAAFQQQLLDIAGTAELTGRAAFTFADKTQRQYEDLALAIGQNSQTVAEGAGQMIAAGIGTDVIDKTIGDIGRATTAANANFADMSNVGVAMLNNLKLPAGEMRDALGALVVAGKLGSFELKDMAASFPGLTSGVAKFGVKGREAVNFLASALQIARKGTSDPAQAANNLGNFLDKALSPLTKKKFTEAGVNIEGVMMDAAAKGLNPIEAVIQKIGKLTGVSENSISKYMVEAKKRGMEGAEALGYVREQMEAIGAAGKVGELFQDKQVLDFLVPFLANIDEYKAIKDKVAAATGAISHADFDTQMQGLNRQLVTFGEIGTQAVRMVGFAFGEWLPDINAGLMQALGWLRAFDESSGGTVTTAIKFAGAGLLMATALGALSFVLPIVWSGLAALGALAAVIVSPIGILIAALGAGAAYVWKNWDRYGPRVMRIWERAKTGFRAFASDLAERGRRIVETGRAMVERYGPVVADGFRRAWAGASAAMAGVGGFARDLVTAFSAGDWELAGMIAADGIANGLSSLWTSAGAVFGSARDWVSGVDWTGIGTQISDQVMTGLIGLRDNVGASLTGAFTVAKSKLSAIDWSGIDWSGIGNQIGQKGAEWGIAGGKAIVAGLGSALSAVGDITGAIAVKLLSLNWSEIGSVWLAAMKAQFNLLTGVVSGAATTIVDAFSGISIDWASILPSWVIWTGNMIGAAIEWVAKGVTAVVQAFQGMAVNWEALLPPGVAGIASSIASAVNSAASAINALKAAAQGFSLDGLVAPGVVEGKKAGDAGFGIGEMVGKPPVTKAPAEGSTGVDPTTTNSIGKQSSLGSPTRMAAVQKPVRLDGNVSVTIKVDGPGKVTGVSSNNPQVAATAGSGRMVGRV